MTRSQYLGHLLFKPRDSSERFVQVLIWAIALMVGGDMLWSSWNTYVVRGEKFSWEHDGKHLAGLVPPVLMFTGAMMLDPKKKWRLRLGSTLLWVGLVIPYVIDFSWTKILWMGGFLLAGYVVIWLWPGLPLKLAAKLKGLDRFAAAEDRERETVAPGEK